MLTADEFAVVLAKREKRKKPFSRSYIFQLVNARRIDPPPERIGKGRGVYIFEDDAKLIAYKP